MTKSGLPYGISMSAMIFPAKKRPAHPAAARTMSMRISLLLRSARWPRKLMRFPFFMRGNYTTETGVGMHFHSSALRSILSSMATETILVVEDESSVARGLEYGLKAEGFTVLLAVNGKKA